jgi:DNA-binding NarL/FixJ family response regulator
MSDEGTVRVLIADDHRLFRDGVAALLSVTPLIEVVGEATDAESAVRLSLSNHPDVVLMDLQMPGGGLSATAELAARAPGIAVLVLTMFDDDDSVFAAIRAGARGYVLKDSEPPDLLRAIGSAASGEAIFGRAVASRMLDWFAGRRAAAAAQPFEDLTASERNVLRLISRGLGNAAIASELTISQKTVRNYVSAIFRKLQVADRSQAVIRARDAGMHLET